MLARQRNSLKWSNKVSANSFLEGINIEGKDISSDVDDCPMLRFC